MTDITKYADMYASLDVLEPFGTHSQGAFLITGEDADGLAVLARLLAARLCGIDSSRAFDEYADITTYPDPNLPEEEGGKSKKTKKTDPAKASPMTVADVREIVGSLYLTPFKLNRRVYIIKNAESMSDICQNKLLKSLEEPPEHVCFVLCSCGALLPTVESRCIHIELPPFSVDTVYDRLYNSHINKDSAEIRLAARASRGNIGMAERILADADYMSAYRDAVNILGLATGSKVFAKASAVSDRYSRERASAVIGLMEYVLGDIARRLVGADTVFDPADIDRISAGFTPYSAAACAELVRDAQTRVRANCMPQAVMDVLILNIMEEKSLCRR